MSIFEELDKAAGAYAEARQDVQDRFQNPTDLAVITSLLLAHAHWIEMRIVVALAQDAGYLRPRQSP